MDYPAEKQAGPPVTRPTSAHRQAGRVTFAALLTVTLLAGPLSSFVQPHVASLLTVHRSGYRPKSVRTDAVWKDEVLRCQRLDLLPGPPEGFEKRTESDRYVRGTPPVLIRNATVWTGLDDGHELLLATDVLLSNGLITRVGTPSISASALSKDTIIHEAHGAWLTPGIFDMHSHIGDYALPDLSGASDGNSIQNPILPHLRSLDSINTHDVSYRRSISGGVTSALILPGSANNIGGQAFVIKLRDTAAKTPDSKVLEMPYHIPSPEQVEWKAGDRPRWRHMKMACGENIRRVYKQVRMDLAWNFRSSFEEARKLKIKQDAFCSKVLASHSKGFTLSEDEGAFPDDLKLEALVDVLRGKVKVNTHCYEQTDLAAFVRHTNEFQFPVAAFHHAHEAYTVPDLLKNAWNSTPVVAIFATNARYKREAWRGSEYAAQILAENNITVAFKSDHPVLDSRYLMFEAQQGHHFGLPEHLALSAVTRVPAVATGFGHRAGVIKSNYDADVVLWDSHPLSLGATPSQVYIDGILQLDDAFHSKALSTSTTAPPIAERPHNPLTLRTDEDEERSDWESSRSKHDLDRTGPLHMTEVVFANVSEVLLRRSGAQGISDLSPTSGGAPFTVRLRDGAITCIGVCPTSPSDTVIDLQRGSILPPLTIFGPAIGLTEMISEQSTTDAVVYDPLLTVDGLEFGGKHLTVAKEAGISKAVTAPLGEGFFRGVSVAFRVDAKNVLEEGAIIKEVVALHVTLGHFKLQQRASVSTQIGELRRLLLHKTSSHEDPTAPDYFALAGKGDIPLVINAWKADTIATVILLKNEVQEKAGKPLRWIIHGGQEAHLVADELAAADIAVILSPPRAIPESWDERRALPGPPLAKRSAPAVLHHAGVKVALGVPEEWQARTLLWEAAWAARNSNEELSRADAVAWISSGLEEMLGLPSPHEFEEFVAFQRDPFEFGSRPVAMSSTDGLSVALLP